MQTTRATEISRSQLGITRAPARGSGGAVAGKMDAAVSVGTEILANGGNAFDAAVATAFAMGVVEPWMNGLGGGGFLVGWLAAEQRAFTIEYPMISGSGATEDMFPLAGGVDAGLFGWPSTEGNANVSGYRSIAVPGTVAGLALALERYGTMSLADILAPAIDLAERGVPVTWHTTLTIARDLAQLRRFPATASTYLVDGELPPVTVATAQAPRLRNPDLANTLRAIADGGPDAFYRGDLARRLTDDLAANGSVITAEDFAAYQAGEHEALTFPFAGHDVHAVGGACGGPTMRQSLGILERLGFDGLAHNRPELLHRYAFAFRQAFADRFTYMADPTAVDVPLEQMLSDEYLDARAAEFDPDRSLAPRAGTREQLGVTHDLAASVGEYMRDGSTTHLGVIDREGNAVSITQTLLGLWGSRVTLPGTGVLMNNGMMWFDPEPGRPNSVGPRKRPLANMSPALVTRNNRIVASVGSSGGRKIMNCNAQIIANLTAFGMPMAEALAAPRIDASTLAVPISSRIEAETIESLRQMGYDMDVVDETLLIGGFASPVAIGVDEEGMLEAAVDAWYYPATARALE